MLSRIFYTAYNETPTKGIMMNIIPVTPATIDLITKLNDGVRPELETAEETFYVYRGEDKPASIISAEELELNEEYQVYMTIIKICYIGT
jgi:hypothetical protein